MAKIAVFSDLHAHGFKAYSTILENGMNSRLYDAVHCVEQIFDYCMDHDIEVVLFGGDLFHVRRNISVSAFNAMYDILSKFVVCGIQVVLIHGNHDQVNKKGTEHSLHAFNAFATVISEPGWETIEIHGDGGELAVLGVPYTENLEHLRDVVNQPYPYREPAHGRIMLGHLGIQGAKVGADFVYTNPHDATVQDLNCRVFDSVYLGHYHIHQKLGPNAHYIGAPLQHNWGDKHQWRGFLIHDTETHTFEKVSLNAPKFVEIGPEEDWTKAQDFEGNYVRLVTDSLWSTDRREDFRERSGALSWEVVPPKKSRKIAEPRVRVDPTKSLREVMGEYVKAGVQPYEGLEPDYLLSIGFDILDEVSEE